MKSNKDLRREALTAIRGKWIWRLLCVFFTLQLLSQTAARMLARLNESRGVISLTDFLQKKFAALQQGLDYTLPTQAAYHQMWIATGFEYFVGTVLGAIAMFGLASVALHAIRNEDENWLSSGFGGFKCPLGVTALLLAQNLIVGLLMLLLVVPGIIAIYRYRQAWYLKCENPEWGVVQCLNESARMMKGYKGQACAFDLGYVGYLFLVGVGLAIGWGLVQVESAVPKAIGSLVVAAAAVSLCYVMMWFTAGRAAFYRALKEERKPETDDDLARND